MALADYHLCHVCGAKVFYDSNCWDSDEWYVEAVEQGRVVALCEQCNKTHEVTVRPRPEADS